MLTDERRMELSDVLRPAAPPREINNVYTDEQRERLLDVVRTEGPWKLIIAQHFASADELIATMSGVFPEGFTPSLDLFLTPTFRGYLANHGAVLYPQLHDCFYNDASWNRQALLERRVRQAGADAVQHQRAVRQPRSGTPGFAEFPRCTARERADLADSVMGKSGLFTDYLIKMAQVITWFSLRRRQRIHLLARGPAQGTAAISAAHQQPRRRGPERDDGAPRRGERAAGTTGSGRTGLRHHVHRRSRRPRPLAAQKRRPGDRPPPHRRVAVPGALVRGGVHRITTN